MKSYNRIDPIFNIDENMQNLLNEIDKKINNLKITDSQKRKNMVTKSKVRSIHSSLAIEANSLSLFDVENISNEKQVIGKRDEIQEVKNAIEAYNQINSFNYKSEKDFIKVHELMMKYFNEDKDGYRNHGEGVEKDGVLIYMAPESILVPSLMKSLFDFINENNNINIIILSAIFHYYFVSIHPFSDGNGRLARYWVSLMLINYNRSFEFIPIEEEMYLNHEEYYSSIAQCHVNGNANVFIKFILDIINSSLDKVIKNNSFVMSNIQNKILELIANDKYITQNIIADKLNVNVRTIKRNFKILIENNILKRVGSDKNGYWELL